MNDNRYTDLDKKLAVLSLLSKNEEELANALIQEIEVKDSDIEVNQMLNELEENIES